MERLPERHGDFRADRSGDDFRKDKRKRNREKASTYGFFMLLIVILIILMSDSPVPLEQLTVNDVRVLEGHEEDGVFVAGVLDDEAGLFSKADVVFDSSSGSAEVCVRQYDFSLFFGTKEFVAQIKEKPVSVKEIWLVYTDSEGNEERTRLEWDSSAWS